jgi:death-on-curing protein
LKWIALEELILIHEHVIKETGGVHGVINPGALESALLRPFTSFEGQMLFPTPWGKIAALIHSLVAFHPFADGNKRTALVAADVCLRLNGYRLPPSKAIEPFFWAVARGEKSITEITAWIEKHTKPLEE